MRSLFVLFLPIIALAGNPDFRVERLPIPGGSELITVFGPIAGAKGAAEAPLLSVLRDDLGEADPESSRLRYVWVLTSMPPGLMQRAVGSLPFFYWRADFGRNPDKRPSPVIDLGSPARPVWHSIAGALTQALALDPTGALIRTPTRSYRNNLEDQHRVRLLEGLAILSELEDDPEVKALLSEPELTEIETRLNLGARMLGGLLTTEKVPQAYVKERTRAEEMRGHNWELLRQRAEANGLYFEPFGVNGSATHALLWIAAADVNSRRKFDGQFLAISNPYQDSRLLNWKGYREVRDGREMIPLALYALEYPKVPLLLADLRNTYSPKRREMIRHAITDTAGGVLGISKFGNWPYLCGSTAFNFVRVRHGSTNDRNARLKAYAEVREWLALDDSLPPGLSHLLQQRLEMMGVNPMEQGVLHQADIARRQYAALVRYATDPEGLPARVEHDRNRELAAYRHGAGARFGFRMASIATLGLIDHREKETGQELEARLDRERRLASQTRFLEMVARSGPQAEIVWNMEEVRRAVDEIVALGIPQRSASLVARIMRETQDQETRAICARALESLEAPGAGGGFQE
ncbi:MAG TPA: hypothetical protein VKX39_12260 [Bryobacteraceae bacterium]|jgi:hypothetical protein|nr:hypothetical protein [Bryobacteraceae bacterium]